VAAKYPQRIDGCSLVRRSLTRHMKILVFAPHSAIWIHAFPEALVANALQSAGHEIVYVSCGRTFERFCVAMSASRLSVDSSQSLRSKICAECVSNDGLLRAELGLSGPNLRDILTADDLQEVEIILDAFTRESVSSLQQDGIFVGRVALYQLLLRVKKFDLDFSEQEWQQYLVELRNTLYAFKAGKRLIDRHAPDRVIVYNGLYSVNRAVCLLAESRGIPSYFLHAGGNLANRLQTLMVGRGNPYTYMPRLLEEWPSFSSVACSPKELSAVTDHFLELLRGQSIFVYSKSRSDRVFDARAFFGLRWDQKLIVATMSSNDEEMAGIMVGAQAPRQGLLFSTQIEWIRAVTEFVRGRPDLFLVIRVHPREFPNRRDGKKSQHAHLLEAAFSDIPPNVAVNWPEGNISLYDLVDQTDAFLNAWSSTGKDMPLLGIPVVTYSSKIQWYPADLNYLGETRESYLAAIDQALNDGWNFENARRAYRWAVFEFITSTISIRDNYPAVENPDRKLIEKIVGRVRRSIDPDYGKRGDMRRRRETLGASRQIVDLLESAGSTIVERLHLEKSDAASLDEETTALQFELKRLATALFPDPSSRAKSRLYNALCGRDR
jgi:hypothetical protein